MSEDKTPRPETTFVVFTRAKGDVSWSILGEQYVGRTQDEAKRKAARALSDSEEYGPIINGDGLEIAVTSARSVVCMFLRRVAVWSGSTTL